MDRLFEFAEANIWLCAVIAIVVVIVADEVLGVSRGLFGDDDEEVAEEERAERREAARAADDAPAADPDTPTVEDLLDPPKRRR